ncbi:MAG: alcohol dehydrogenase [Synergistaceae bacterium]|jgi:ribosomal protein S27AE|nr:alcohol dehydrogenase [Synergistaceae bacterium]MDD3672184.1 alcohol dehydrogenase [Synergistaceae bacterium]
MLIVACQKCGEVKVLAGSPGPDGIARAVWTCSKCGAGQVMELTISKDARRGDLRKIIGGLALAGHIQEKHGSCEENVEGCNYDQEETEDDPDETKF